MGEGGGRVRGRGEREKEGWRRGSREGGGGGRIHTLTIIIKLELVVRLKTRMLRMREALLV